MHFLVHKCTHGCISVRFSNIFPKICKNHICLTMPSTHSLVRYDVYQGLQSHLVEFKGSRGDRKPNNFYSILSLHQINKVNRGIVPGNISKEMKNFIKLYLAKYCFYRSPTHSLVPRGHREALTMISVRQNIQKT